MFCRNYKFKSSACLIFFIKIIFKYIKACYYIGSLFTKHAIIFFNFFFFYILDFNFFVPLEPNSEQLNHDNDNEKNPQCKYLTMLFLNIQCVSLNLLLSQVRQIGYTSILMKF